MERLGMDMGEESGAMDDDMEMATFCRESHMYMQSQWDSIATLLLFWMASLLAPLGIKLLRERSDGAQRRLAHLLLGAVWVLVLAGFASAAPRKQVGIFIAVSFLYLLLLPLYVLVDSKYGDEVHPFRHNVEREPEVHAHYGTDAAAPLQNHQQRTHRRKRRVDAAAAADMELEQLVNGDASSPVSGGGGNERGASKKVHGASGVTMGSKSATAAEHFLIHTEDDEEVAFAADVESNALASSARYGDPAIDGHERYMAGGSRLSRAGQLSVMGFECVMVLLSIFLAILGTWTTWGCSMHGADFLGDEIGHLIPASFTVIAAHISLLYYRPARPLALQRTEGKLFLTLGLFFLLEFTIMHGGGGFRHWITGKPNSNWMKDQQHQLDGMMWMTSGLMAIGLARLQVVTGLHWFIGGFVNLVTMFAHPQHCAVETFGHWANGVLLFIAGLLRWSFRLPEFVLFSTLGGVIFVASSPCAVEFWAYTMAKISFIVLVAAVTILVWSFHMFLWWPLHVWKPLTAAHD